MPLEFKTRFWIFMGIIILVSLIMIGVVANANQTSATPKPTASPTPTPTATATAKPSATVSFTINSDIGAETIKITNQNTGQSILLVVKDLPATFRCQRDDQLSFTVTAKEGYTWNAWVTNNMVFHSDNPYTLKVNESFAMTAQFLLNQTVEEP